MSNIGWLDLGDDGIRLVTIDGVSEAMPYPEWGPEQQAWVDSLPKGSITITPEGDTLST
jgi:hypothetical protein